jgi:putative transposase
MDFLTGFPSISGKDSLLVVVDRFSKRAHFIPVPVSISAESTAKVIIREVVRLHGVPESIVSDRDPRFTSDVWQSLWRSLGTNLLMSSSSHPQTDGITERTNRTLLAMLRATLSSNPGNWLELVPLVEFAYNSSMHTAIRMSPFEADIGYKPPSPLDLASGTQQLQPCDLISKLQLVSRQVTEHLSQAQAKYEKQYNKNTCTTTYRPGDWVLVASDQLRLPQHKLRNPWSGPYQVLQVPHPATVTLDLREHTRIHPTINTKFVKAFSKPEDELAVANTETAGGATNSPQSRPKRHTQPPIRYRDATSPRQPGGV